MNTFSPSELEAFQLCPFRYYAQSVLKLKTETRGEAEMTPPETGRMIHKILEGLLSKGSVTRERGREILEQEITSFRQERPHLSPVLLELHQKRIERTLDSFIEDFEEERRQQRSLAPQFFEWSFVMDGPRISLRGRVDRIDVDEKQKRFLVIDYKTGSTKISGNKVRSGEALQLPLYILAVKRLLLPDYEPIGGLYYQLSDMSKRDGILRAERLPDFLDIHPRSSSLVPAAKWDETFALIEEKTRTIVAEIQKGLFPSRMEPCDPYCPYQDICKIRTL